MRHQKTRKTAAIVLAAAMLLSAFSVSVTAAENDKNTITLEFVSYAGRAEGQTDGWGFDNTIEYTYSTDDTITLSDIFPDPTDDMFEFKGWSYGSDPIETISGEELSGYSRVCFYAEWDEPENADDYYYVILNAGPGTVKGKTPLTRFDGNNFYVYSFPVSEVDTDDWSAGPVMVLPDAELKGADFAGWNYYYDFGESRTKSVVYPFEFDRETLIEIDASYSVKESDTFDGKFILDANGGTIDGAAVSSRVPVFVGDSSSGGMASVLQYLPDEREGYTFIGWSDSPEGSEYQCGAFGKWWSGDFDDDEAKVLYAMWHKNVFTSASDADNRLTAKIEEELYHSESYGFFYDNPEIRNTLLKAAAEGKTIIPELCLEKADASKTAEIQESFKNSYYDLSRISGDAYKLYLSFKADGKEIARVTKISDLMDEAIISLPEDIEIPVDTTGRRIPMCFVAAVTNAKDQGNDPDIYNYVFSIDGNRIKLSFYDLESDLSDVYLFFSPELTGEYHVNFYSSGDESFGERSYSFNFLSDSDKVRISDMISEEPKPSPAAPYEKFLGWGSWIYDKENEESTFKIYTEVTRSDFEGRTSLYLISGFDETKPKNSGTYYINVDLHGGHWQDVSEFTPLDVADPMYYYTNVKASEFKNITLPQPVYVTDPELPDDDPLVFVGWNCEFDEQTGTLVSHDPVITKNDFSGSDVADFVACYSRPTTKDKAVYTLDANGGTIDGNSVGYYRLTSLGSADAEKFYLHIPVRKGYKFKGWNTKADGSGKTVMASSYYFLIMEGLCDENAKLTLYAQWEQTGTDGIRGDVTGDNDVNIADALLIARYDAGLSEISQDVLSNGDVTGDDDVNIADALLIARYDAGLASLD